MMRGSGSGWWLVGAAFMIFCMVIMAKMMMGHGHSGNDRHGATDDAERTLATRLAKGEIDIEEYNRLLEALRRSSEPMRM